MALTTAQIQQAYVTFFSRPADPVGLAYWQAYTGSVADLYATFAQQTEYSAAFSGLTSAQKVNVVYQNLFGRDAEATGLLYWAGKVESGAITVANLALAVSAGSQGTDLVTVNSRVSAATSFSAALDTPAEILGYTGATANAAAKTWLAGVTTAANLATAVAAIDTATAAVVAVGGAAGSTFTLTTGVDTVSGTSGSDTINAILGTGATLNSFDSIASAAGTDTLNIADNSTAAFAMPASVSLSGIENVTLSRSGATGAADVTVTNTTFGTGVQNFSVVNAGANTTGPVDITLNSANTVSAAATGTAFTTVAVTDTSTTAASTGNTLKTVTVNKATGAATLTGNGITTVNMNAVGGLTTVTAASGTRDLTINASGTTTEGGLTDATATSATLNVSGAQTFGTLTVAKAGTVTINTNAAATTTLVAATATTLNLGGTNLNTLTAGAGNAALTTINVSGAGGVAADVSAIATLTTLDFSSSTAKAPASGSLTGANTFTVGVNTVVTGGAGEEVISVGATNKAINLGAGNDTAIVSVTALGALGSINGGDGVDTLKLANADAVTLSTAGAAQTAFKTAVTGFESLDITAQAASTIALDAVGTFSTVKFVSAATAQVFTGAANGLTIADTYGAAGTSVTLNNLSGASDVLNIQLKGDLSTAARVFGSFVTPGVETVNITTADSTASVTAQQATATLTDANATTINVSGNNGLALTHTGTALTTFNASGVTKGGVTFASGVLTTDAVVTGSSVGGDSLDFSASVAKVTINATAGANTLKGSATIGSTINGGSGVDTITGGAGVDTINGGAGNDVITAGAGKDVMTGGTGSDTFAFAVGDSSAAVGDFDTITDFLAGTDKLQFTAFVDVVSAQQSAVQAAVTALAAGSTAAQIETAMLLANTTDLGVAFATYGGDTYVLAETTGANTAATAGVAGTTVFIKLAGVTTLPTFAADVTA